MPLAPGMTTIYPPQPYPYDATSGGWKRYVHSFHGKSKQVAEKVAASGFWRKICALFTRTLSEFTTHPSLTNETYLQHLWFTVKTSLRFLLIGVLLLTHGICPFLFTRTASSQIEQIYRMMRARIPKVRREAIDIEYDI